MENMTISGETGGETNRSKCHYEFRDLLPVDAASLAGWNEGKEDDFLMQWAGRAFHAPLTSEQILTDSKNVSAAVFAIYEKQAKKDITESTDGADLAGTIVRSVNEAAMIGTIALITLDSQAHSGYLGHFLLDPALAGQGLGTAVMHEFIQYCDEELDLQKLTLRVFAYNTPAVRCYEKSGYKITERSKMENGTEVWSMEVHNAGGKMDG